MVTDLAEILRIGTAKETENLAFRRYLSAKHASDEPFKILAREIQQHVDCTACANCCRNSIVQIGEKEVDAIAQHLGVTTQEVARLYTIPGPEAGSRILASSAEGCVFLEGNLCLIYEARPKACRDFPHVAAGRNTLGARPSSLARWASLCPIIFNALEEYKHRTGYHSHQRRGGSVSAVA